MEQNVVHVCWWENFSSHGWLAPKPALEMERILSSAAMYSSMRLRCGLEHGRPHFHYKYFRDRSRVQGTNIFAIVLFNTNNVVE